MPLTRALLSAALLALAGASGPAIAEALRLECRADDAIPEFVTRRVELVTVARDAGGPTEAAAVELERDPSCRTLRTEP